MSNTLEIGTVSIACEKITAIQHENGKTHIIVMGGDNLEYPDMDGMRYRRVMQEWRSYLQSREQRFQEAVQYGIIMGMERGALNAK